MEMKKLGMIGMMMRPLLSAHILLMAVVLQMFLVHDDGRMVQAQTILDQFPNLFRGGRRNQTMQGSTLATESTLLAIQPIGTSRSRGSSLPSSSQGGLIRLDSRLWNQAVIEVELFDSSRYKFRQSLEDQPKAHSFYGRLVLENNDNDDEEDGTETSSISLVRTTVTPSQLPVITGSVHVQGILYQLRQLPSGDLILDQRGSFDESFEDEVELEDDDIRLVEWEGQKNFTKMGAGELEVDLPYGGQRWRKRRLHNNSTEARLLQNGDDGSLLDILIIYSRNAMCAAAGFPNNQCQASSENKATIEGIIELAVQETNEAFANSGIKTTLRAVKVHYEDEFDDTAEPWPVVFSHFTGEKTGKMDYVHAMRDQYGADFVTFIVNSRGYCGSAHRPSVPSADRAFSMVRWDCATGHYTFTHELAHTFGCRHDRESTNTYYDPDDYNFGYQYYQNTRTVSSRFRTLMAYNCPDGGCQRILQFSTPSRGRSGVPYGNSQADNARFIKERLHIYANFRQSIVPIQKPPPPNPQSAPPAPRNPVIASVYRPGTSRFDSVPHPGSLIGAAGNMFEVVAKSDLKVTGFAVIPYASTTCIVEVYKLNELGSFIGKERDPEAWTLVGRVEIESRENQFNELPTGTIDPVVINADTTQAFYVTFQDDTNYNRYSKATRYGDVAAENDEIQFKVGYTANHPFRYHPKAPRIFNGAILYEKLQVPLNASSVSEAGGGTNELGVQYKTFHTSFQSNNGFAGNLFTIQAKTDMVVERFDLNVGSTDKGIHVLIYTKFGDYGRVDADPGRYWTEICNTDVDGQGESKPTQVPFEAVKSVAIKANERQSFYITFTANYMKYTTGAVDPNYLSNEDVSLAASAGTQYPFQGYFPDRIWNGNVVYRLNDLDSADVQGRETEVKSVSGSEQVYAEEGNSYAYGAVSTRQPQA